MKNNLKNTDKTKFSKDNQPSPEAISKGMKKASLLRSVGATIITGGVKDAVIPLAQYLGIEVDKIDIEMVMHLKQIEKAIKESDTIAYNAVMNRLKGKVPDSIKFEDISEVKPNTILNFKDYNGDK